MGAPIKISDDLYERLKQQAASQGITLQDALVELITTPHEGLSILQSQLKEAQRAIASQADSQKARNKEIKALRADLQELHARTDRLFELRNKDIKAFNDWATTWEETNPLLKRVSSLERLSHRHLGMNP